VQATKSPTPERNTRFPLVRILRLDVEVFLFGDANHKFLKQSEIATMAG
jgi:hypothetical protein